MRRRLGAPANILFAVQSNLASTYKIIGRAEEALDMYRGVYSGILKLRGEEHDETLRAANNYALSLADLQRFKEAKSLMRKTMPVVRRVRGVDNFLTLLMSWLYASTLYKDPDATLDEVREAVSTLEDTERTARRVLGGAHPQTMNMEQSLRKARAALRARETPATE